MVRLVRFLVFVLALAIGVVAANVSWNQLSTDHDRFLTSCPVDEPQEEPGVLVTYAGFQKTDTQGQQWISFKIDNRLSQPLEYFAHRPGGLMPNIRVNGSETAGVFRCGVGLQMFYLPPGSSIDVNVSSSDFVTRPAKDDTISIGFSLNKSVEGESESYWSEPIVLPEDFRLAIRDR